MIQGDITKQDTDVIVNAANCALIGGGGVDGAIHKEGGPKILEECLKIVSKQGNLHTGKAVITTGGNLFAKYVIHAVGPVWHGGLNNESQLLSNTYVESLKVATNNHVKSISFPSISTGAYRYPVDKAAMVAVRSVISFIKENASLEEVRFVLFDAKTYEAYSNALEEELREYK